MFYLFSFLPSNFAIKLWRNSLLFQLVSSFLLLSLLIIALVGYAAFDHAKESLKKSAFDQLNMIAVLKYQELNHWVFDQSQVVLSLTQLPHIKTQSEILFTAETSTQEYDAAKLALQNSLIAFINYDSGLKEIFILSRGGRVLVSTNPKQVGQYQALVQYSQIQDDSKDAFVSNFYRSSVTGQPQITLTYPLFDPAGQRLGAIAANLNLARIDEIIRHRTGLQKTGETYLVGNIGTTSSSRYVFMNSQTSGTHPLQLEINSEAIEKAMQGYTGQGLYRNYKGVPVIGVYYSLSDQDLVLLAEQSQSEAFAPAQELAISILLIGLLLSGIMAIGMFLLGRRIVRPILEIVKTARSVSQGNFNQTAPVLTSNEIGLLARTFNQMTKELKNSYSSLEDYNRNLEMKVAARTQELHENNQRLIDILKELKQTQLQLIQNEKMVSLGQLVAGVAHEINNPVNFIYGNIDFALEYSENLIHLTQIYQNTYPNPTPELENLLNEIEFDYMVSDLPNLFKSMQEGANRIKEIVLSLKNFSRLDESEQKKIDIHQGLESTLQILQMRLKPQGKCPAIEVKKNYGHLPQINCYPGQLNQVYMNLLSNAIDALQDCWNNSSQHCSLKSPQIQIMTTVIDQQWILIEITDNASGILPEVQKRIFDPFFTTKPVGKGTGLGLSISYKIIVEQHQGKLICHSRLGEGTTFSIELPLIKKQD